MATTKDSPGDRAIRVLLLEDRATDADLMIRELRRAGFAPDVVRVERRAEFVQRLDEEWELILSDYNLPDITGLKAADLVRERKLEVPLIIVSGTVGDELAAECIKRGAHDYVLKDRLARLGPAVTNAMEAVRLRAERRIGRHLEVLQATALETAADGIVITDVKGVISWVNPAFTRMTGYSAEEAIGQTPRLLKSGRHGRDYYKKLWDTLLSGETWRGNFVNRRKDGTIYEDEHTITPVRTGGEEITHFIAIMHDVTEKRKAEESLRLFRALVDQSSDALEIIDPPTGRFLDVNDRECLDLGYPREELLRLGVPDIDPAFTTSEMWPALAREIKVTGELRGESTHRRKDGSEFPIEYHARWVTLDRDYVVTVVRDITRRKAAEAELRESEERFRQVVENINEVFWMTDTTKNRMLYVSPGYDEIWGRPAAELYQSPGTWADAIHPEDRARVKEAARTKQAAGQYDETYRIVRPDGSVRWIHDQAYPIRESDGSVSRVVGIAGDVTENKKLEEQFLRAQRMEAIGTLAGGIAHDLNNILAPMLMVSGVLKPKLSDPEDLRLLNIVEASAERGSGIISQLMSFSRGTGGTRASVQLRHLVKEIMEMARETFPREIQIEGGVPGGLWTVAGNATQLHQMALNLCVNARDAMPDGGRLTLGGRNLEMDEEEARRHAEARPGRYVLFTVSDTGTGIPPEILDRIFDPFFTTKQPGKGTGLGLASVAGIVKGHGGFVTVYSEPGHGTTFRVYLPAESDRTVPEETAKRASPTGNGELILVVDDEANIRETVKAMLERKGYRVTTAANGEQALLELNNRSGEIKLVLTDIMMPVMGGFALIRSLRTIAPSLPVIACSGLPRGVDLDILGDARIGAFLSKPFDSSTLLNEVHRLLNSAGEN
jgi:PAS domain S-box-containing protein